MGKKLQIIGTLEDYEEILKDVRSLLEKANIQAYKALDTLRVQTYWQMGERIARSEFCHKERADYGNRVVEKLSKDLGFQKRLIYRIVQFYKTYPFVSSLTKELSWSHYQELIVLDDPEERKFYEIQIIQNHWSVHQLRQEIQKRLYQRQIKESQIPILAPLPLQPLQPEQLVKSSYNFEFADLPEGYSERDLEECLMKNVAKLLLEFGHDFSLTGHQRKIVIDQQIHAVDIEFYHRGIPCILLVDLKIGSFKSEYVGQMNKYLNYYRENKMYPWEKPPIGIIICEYKGQEEVHYALGCLQNKIFVAEYKTKLPSEQEMQERLQQIRQPN